MATEKIDQAALRQRFNPDGSLLRRQQMRMLELLIEVDRICKKHNIKYWLGSGTLIGAARHKGFIPWDDDLDIEMLWDVLRWFRKRRKSHPAYSAGLLPSQPSRVGCSCSSCPR